MNAPEKKIEVSNVIEPYFSEEKSSTNQSINSACRMLTKEIKSSNAQVLLERLHDLRLRHSDQVQIFLALISNSIKFRKKKEPPIIHISSEIFGPDVIFKVEDNGIGIPQQMWGSVFGVYNKIYANKKGAGVGLALCKAILDDHKGYMWVGQSSNEGTTMYFSLGE